MGDKGLAGAHDASELAEKPSADLDHLVDLGHRVTLGHGVGKGEHALVGGIGELLIDIFVDNDLVLIVDAANGLLSTPQGFGQRS